MVTLKSITNRGVDIKRYLYFCLCMMLFAHPLFAKEKDAEKITIAEDEAYLEIIDRLKGGDKEIDFLELRMLYAKTGFYIPYGYSERKEIRIKAIEAFKKENYKKVLKLAEKIFENDYLDLNTHFMCMISYKNLEESEKEEYHKFVLNGLIDSVVSYGDGRSPETAYKVISTREEEFILTTLGYITATRDEIRTKKHAFDKIFAKNLENQKKKVLYFNKDVPNKWLNDKYSGVIDPEKEQEKESRWDRFKKDYITYED